MRMLKRLRRNGLLFLLYLFSLQSNAQERMVSGIITDEKGVPLKAASILVKGKKAAALSDENGQFSVNAKTGDQLLVSYVNYLLYEYRITGSDKIVIKLSPEIKDLNDVVVIGYGSVKKKDLTGSVITVNSASFNKAPVTNVEGLIANKVPGVQVTPISGRPGAGSSILVRGGASLNAGNDPLVVVDGLPLEGWNSVGPGMLSQLNPDDIESFTFLKDASATAIYGSRASNGVIIITTRKGSAGAMRIQFSTKATASVLIKEAPVLSGNEYRSLIKSGLPTGTNPSIAPGTANTDWQKEIFRTAFATDNSISVSGGIKKLPYRFSLGYLNQDGILKTGNYKRYSALLNLSPVFFNNHLKINLNLKAGYENQKTADESAIYAATVFDPTQPVYMADKTYGGYFQYTQFASNPAVLHGANNPVSILEQQQNVNSGLRGTGNLELDYSFHYLPDLHLHVNAGYDLATSRNSYFAPASYFPVSISGGFNNKANPSARLFNRVFEGYLNYAKEYARYKSKIDLTAGYSYNDYLSTNYYYSNYDAAGYLQPNSQPTNPFDKPSHSILSYYGRLIYTFNNKYLLTATLRDDASSRFAEKYRWGIFPSAAFAWKIKEEKFLRNNKFVSDLKLRLGYGVTGQQDGIGNYIPIPVYNIGGLTSQYLVGNTPFQNAYPSAYNPNLKWEQTTAKNIALDFGFFQNRISGSLDLYEKKTSDLLNQTQIPLGVNFSNSLLLNIGDMENRGAELLIKAIPIQKKNLNWDIAFNISYNKNKITHLNNVSDEGVGLFSNLQLVNTVGYSRNSFYLYHQIYKANGQPVEDVMLDMNKDGLTNAKDRYISGKSSLPSYILGLSSNLSLRNWTLGFALHANLGQYIFYQPSDNTIAITQYAASQNLSTLYYQNRFGKSNQYQSYSDLYLQNASFLRMDNVYAQYNFGKISKHLPVGLRATASVQRVFTISNFTGLDPEAAYNSGYQLGYPIPRVYAIGVNLEF